ncbi:MAG TPA: hypothetical protein IAC49_03825, partial [Candidatus Ventricola intestinavium]|nr:hypothetical protein [Candidatus Ventricola intestinavium]
MAKRLACCLMSMLLLISGVPALGEEGEELHYIEPTWVENEDGPTIGYTVKGVLEV